MKVKEMVEMLKTVDQEADLMISIAFRIGKSSLHKVEGEVEAEPEMINRRRSDKKTLVIFGCAENQ
jgi:hypothetical protein